MSEGLQAYVTNKIISVASIAAVIVGSLWYLGYTETQWQFVMITLMTFGYSHYIIGWFYQLRGFLRKDNPRQHFITFWALIVFSIALTFIFYQLSTFFALLTLLLYFLVHGLLNEQTLFFKQTKISIPLLYFWPLIILVIGILAYSVPDQTFLMSRDLNFLPSNNFLFLVYLNDIGISLQTFTTIFWVSAATAFAVLFFAWLQSQRNALAVGLGVALGSVVMLTHFFGALPYVYMLFLVVGYHFVTWFLFYVEGFKKRSTSKLREFIIVHLVVIAPYALAGFYFFEAATPGWAFLLFDYYYFGYATFAHITTSFMNDEWLQKLQTRVFQVVG